MRSVLLSFAALTLLLGCATPEPPAPPPDDSVGMCEAIVEIGDGGGILFLADRSVVASMRPSKDGGELVIHAGSDVAQSIGRLVLAFVFDLDDPALPGTVDLSRHTVVLMEQDHSGVADLVLDGPPTGTAEILGVLEPGREISGTFSVLIPGRDEVGEAMEARVDGTFSVVIAR